MIGRGGEEDPPATRSARGSALLAKGVRQVAGAGADAGPDDSGFATARTSAPPAASWRRRRGRSAPWCAPFVPDISKVEPCSRISMKTKSGTSARISSRNDVQAAAALDRLDDDRVRQAFRQKLTASSTEPTKSTSMLMCCAARRGSCTRISRREATTSTWLPASAFELPRLASRRRRSPRPTGLPSPRSRSRELEHQGADAGNVLRSTDQAHRPARSARSGAS